MRRAHHDRMVALVCPESSAKVTVTPGLSQGRCEACSRRFPMRRTARFLLSSALALGAACSQPHSATTAPRSSADVITSQDIRATSFTNVYDVIAQLRFRWLQARGTDTVNLQPGDVVVRLDDDELGTV